jgi:signal transduction histidine kinase
MPGAGRPTPDLMPRPRNSKDRAASRVVPPELEIRCRFLGFCQEDAALLSELHDLFAEHADEVVMRFYDHLRAFEPLRVFLDDPQTRARLNKVQKEYLLSLTRVEIGEEYLANRTRIGRIHERVGLHPQWYLGAYGNLMDQLCPLIMGHFGKNRKQGVRACLALAKLMNLDSQVVLGAYFETRQQRAVEKSEQLAAIGEMAASIAHEVRNPLAGMKGAMEVLRQHLGTDPSHADVVDELMAQIVRLETLVRDLLTYARPRPLSRQPVELPHLLDRVLRFVQEDGHPRVLNVERDYDPRSSRIVADPQQLEQLFLNLIQNAAQAMEDGGTLAVSTGANGGQVEIVFSDTGQGIAVRDLPRIYQPFFTTRHRGSGLGLTIVRKIVDDHGGSIRVESGPGTGTTATVTLPIGDEE